MAISYKQLRLMMKVNKATTSGNKGAFGHWAYCNTLFTIIFWRQIAKKQITTSSMVLQQSLMHFLIFAVHLQDLFPMNCHL
jgi:hypothetical protein